MRILALSSKESGVGYHRIMMPLVHLHKDYCLITDTLSEEVVDNNYDLLIMNRMLSNISPKQLDEWRTKFGFKIIVDNDDYWELPPSHVLYNSYQEKNIGEQIIEFIKIADLCTCTHERLADEIREYNPNVEIIPNALPYGEEQFLDDKLDSKLIRLFWSGSGTHERDMDLLRNPMKRINFPIRTIIAGYNEGEKPIWDKMIGAFTNGLKLNPTIYNYSEVTKYMGAYSDSDISLIPLLDNKFNNLKSNLKVLETASKHNPAIVSHVHPYKGMPCCYIDSQRDWYYWINLLTHDESARVFYGEQLHQYCLKHYSLEVVNKQRLAIYNKLLGNASN